MSYRSDRFNNGMRSVEEMTAGFSDPSKAKVFSDGGAGVGRMLEEIGVREKVPFAAGKGLPTLPVARGRACRPATAAVDDPSRAEALFVAEMRLVEAGKGYLIRVLLLIVENGADFDISINELSATSKSRNAARKKYFEHRSQLLAFFQK